MIKLGNCSNPKEKKINIFPEVILKVLITYQIKISDLKKITNGNKKEDYRNKYEILNKIATGGYGEVYKVKIKKLVN